jgi:hypothetical protein
MILRVAWFAAALPLFAQHVELTANGDGSLLYLTSKAVLRDTATPTYSQTRLYRVGPDGVRLMAE